MTASPKFSVVTVSFNHAEFIRQTIESVLLQKYDNFEHIIIDGGSTDGTIDILQAYPHLIWVSEPDRGQSHALNKGFKRASGDIIAWLNSDDWYAPGIFKDVATALEDYPIIMGECELTDKYGCFKELVPNIERSWFDILKYWIFFSSPAQPSIFFKKNLLEDARRADGNYLDEDLDFCMDYDLWLRICKKYPLTRRLKRVFSYYRTYESNKTGELMDSTYREMSRVFRRYSANLCSQERDVSIVLSSDQPMENLSVTVRSISQQTIPNTEIVVMDCASSREDAQKLRRRVIQLGREFPKVPVRYVRADAREFVLNFNAALESVRAPVLVWTTPGVEFPENFSLLLLKAFEQDNLGLLLPFADQPALKNIFSSRESPGGGFKLESIFNVPFIFPSLIGRHVAFKELGGLSSYKGETSSPLIAVRRLFLRLIYKGWKISAENPFSLPILREKNSLEEGSWEEGTLYLNAQLVKDLCDELVAEPFGVLRLENGFSIGFSEEVISSSQKLLSLAPPDWHHLERYQSMDQLQKLVREFPHFAFGWRRLMRQLGKNAASPQLLNEAQVGYQKALTHQGSLA